MRSAQSGIRTQRPEDLRFGGLPITINCAVPIYLKDVLDNPGLLAFAGKKSRAQTREEAEDRKYEELGREVERNPIGPARRGR